MRVGILHLVRLFGSMLLFLLVPATAFATPPDTHRVAAMLSSFEEGPTEDQWRALGPETLGTLIALYDDTAQPGYVRMRAVETAAYFPSPATRTFLLAVARAEGQSDLFVREAVLALGRAFGAAAVGDLRAFLRAGDRDIREGAVIALARIGTPEARAVLQAHAENERDHAIRVHLQAATTR